MRRIAIPAILFIPVVIWILVQASPNIWPLATHPIWAETAAQLGRNTGAYISIDPELTRNALMVLLAYAGVFWLAVRYGRDRENAITILKFFVIISISYAAYGLIVFFAGWKNILWIPKSAYLGDLTSTFINRNSYATFAGFGVVASVVLLIKVLGTGAERQISIRTALRNFLGKRMSILLLPIIGILICSTAVLLTHSRAGAACMFTAVIVAIFGMRLTATPSLTGFAARYAVIGIAVTGVFIYVLSGDVTENRFAGVDSDAAIRMAVYEPTYNAILTAADTGYGYGSFEPGFRIFKSRKIAGVSWDHAHDSYLEIFFGLGVPGALILLACLVMVGLHLINGIRTRKRDQIFPILAIAILIQIALHSLVDFSIQMPAVGIVLFCLIGVGWAQSFSSMRYNANTKGKEMPLNT
ncbi:O-antigen ligase family protein [Thalassospira mesophila]|nr:O-antigen ligase family protein [Thalassospira mesophila]